MLGDPALKPRERDFLDGLGADQRPMLCDISLWEVALLGERERLELDVTLGTASPPYTDWTWQDLGLQIGGPASITSQARC